MKKIDCEQVEGMVLGKMGKGWEKKVKLWIDENRTPEPLAEDMGMCDVIRMMGNLIDKGLEAVGEENVGVV
ncbi:hypothetical protein [Bacillus licheniformis]|uniref:hypothetical protein n=1 Tax=Bacillus licheniformis TaxID=1402 RepID=UPI0011A32539|nr:hypothetical protein [Bacillus licheniformis]